jgi:hypothetical protein
LTSFSDFTAASFAAILIFSSTSSLVKLSFSPFATSFNAFFDALTLAFSILIFYSFSLDFFIVFPITFFIIFSCVFAVCIADLATALASLASSTFFLAFFTLTTVFPSLVFSAFLLASLASDFALL